MSLINSIANVRKPIGQGRDRHVFYSKKYNVVIKVTKPQVGQFQCHAEKSLFDIMTKKEKEVFPILQTLEYKGKLYIIMKKCTPINDLLDDTPDYNWTVDDLCDRLGLDPSNNFTLMRMEKKYHFRDLHTANLGVDDKNRLVILDGGI